MDGGTWKHYKYINYHTQYITHLTPELIQNPELCNFPQEIIQNEKSSITSFKQVIPGFERDVLNVSLLIPGWTFCLNISLLYFKQKIQYYNNKYHIEYAVPTYQ